MENPAQYLEQEIKVRQSELAEQIVERQYRRNPAYWERYGAEGRRLSVRDAAYHLPFLAEAIRSGDREVFDRYVLWVKQLFRGLGFSDRVMVETLECTREVLQKAFDATYHAIINSYIDSGLEAMEQPVAEMPSYIDTEARNGLLAREYTDDLLKGDRHTAAQRIRSSVEEGVPVKEIYLDVFQMSQYEVGRLWLTNQISVATEHFCSAATQSIMAQLYPYIFSGERLGRRLVASCVGGELHEMGIRMVTDFFEMAGWDTYYLGANTPASSILKAIEEYNADMVALSVAMPYHRSLLRETIAKIREREAGRRVKILIGGNALNAYGDQWAAFGADGYAPNADEAIGRANQLMQIAS